jgi:hypothetical protein
MIYSTALLLVFFFKERESPGVFETHEFLATEFQRIEKKIPCSKQTNRASEVCLAVANASVLR